MLKKIITYVACYRQEEVEAETYAYKSSPDIQMIAPFPNPIAIGQ
jgi:hypothetical protein